jgi:hypothetical protein
MRVLRVKVAAQAREIESLKKQLRTLGDSSDTPRDFIAEPLNLDPPPLEKDEERG